MKDIWTVIDELPESDAKNILFEFITSAAAAAREMGECGKCSFRDECDTTPWSCERLMLKTAMNDVGISYNWEEHRGV